MNKFYLIRHGQKVGESGDPTLTELGRAQAQKTAKHLSDKNLTKILSSTYKRTLETAKIIDDVLKIGLQEDDRLRERVNWGSVPEQSLEDFLKEWDFSTHNRNFKPKAGTSSFEAGKKVEEILQEISENFQDKNIALITHGGVIADLLRNLFHDNELEKYKKILFDEAIKETSITILIKDGDKYTLETVGSTTHL